MTANLRNQIEKVRIAAVGGRGSGPICDGHRSAALDAEEPAR